MTKTKGDYYRNPRHVYKWKCPFCGEQQTPPSENIWTEILFHLSTRHETDLQIQKIATYVYVAKKGWVIKHQGNCYV
jgi:hypothetical protein